MKSARTHLRIASLGLCAAGALLAASAVSAAGSEADRQAQYLKDRAACERGHTGQDLATCLREAGAVRDERRGVQGRQAPDDDTLRANALRRCERLPADQQADCRALTMGNGVQTRGDVPAGGVYRERTIQVPAPQQAPAPYEVPAPAPSRMPAMPPVPAPNSAPVSPMAPITPAPPPPSPGMVR